MKFKICYEKGDLLPAQDKIKSSSLLSIEKDKIDFVSKYWNKIKKHIHEHEYIYTSPNKNRNISDIMPISRSYFKLTEILKDYHISLNDKIIFCMAEAPGGFIQSVTDHPVRKIYANTLLSDEPSVPKWHHTILKNKSIDLFFGQEGTGDLYSLNNILSYIKYIGKGTVDFVTGDGGFDYSEDYNKQEYNSIPLIYSEILLALNLLKTDGIFICKLFDIFTKTTLQLLYILSISFTELYISKPKFSRLSNSEKYVVCKGFRGYNKDIINILLRSFKTKELDIKIDKNFDTSIDFMNQKYLNIQINQIRKGINLDINHIISPTNEQINSAKQWCKEYNIPINTNFYINGQSSHVDFKIGRE